MMPAAIRTPAPTSQYSAAPPDFKPSSKNPRSRAGTAAAVASGGFHFKYLRPAPPDDKVIVAHLCANLRHTGVSDRDPDTMNYVLQVVRGRSATTSLRLASGVTSLGRHDDCIIRIKSSQVSRRHCEIVETDGTLMVRDLGSSNGTFVNGQRVLGQHGLKVGDELTIGSVTLRVATLGQPAPPSHPPAGKPGDTAVVEAVAIDDEEEFEIEFDEGDSATADVEAIPLADLDEAPAAPATPPAKATPEKPAAKAAAEKPSAQPAASKGEDDAVAQFLLDLNLDEE